ncbi:hypothetical protein DPMN_089419 [Dreissena polymorpha]|uniref:EGF-like domain-containing protein n=1 Tax=Dreissena polymorpha TaxID=45954 RepID=A0A9D4KWD6_DREPO|nr:hypothetical protein DPMN_089419 [Dreissena polymorpha]
MPNYVKRPESERSCSGIFLSCEYGICIKETGVKRCECDLGATGPLCEHRCCRDCGAHGSCRIIPKDGCDCERNYKGKNCETRIEVPDIFCNCVHGSCNEAGTCKCYEGWTGATCEISCTDNCGQGNTCVKVFGKVMCMQTGLETTSQRSITIIPRLDACNSSYVLRPVKERSCMGMYNCVYGTCFTQAN